MFGSRQPSALGRGGRAPDVSRGTPARRWGQGAAFTKQARDRTRRLLALALQPGRLLHASRTAPRERGQLKGESQRGGRLALGQASAIYRFFNTSMGRACLARARPQAPGRLIRRVSVCVGSHAPPLCHHPAQRKRGAVFTQATRPLGAVDCGGCWGALAGRLPAGLLGCGAGGAGGWAWGWGLGERQRA